MRKDIPKQPGCDYDSKVCDSYKQVYKALEGERRYWIPELALQLAQSLCHLPDRSLTKEQIDDSVNTWLQLRQVLQRSTSRQW